MCLEALLFYFDHSELSGNDKLAMLVLADFADDRGQCYPGQERIAHRLNMKEPSARKVLYRLRDAGELIIENNKGVHTGSGATNLYTLVKYAQAKSNGWDRSKGDPVGSPLNAQNAQGCDERITHERSDGITKPLVEPSVNTIGDSQSSSQSPVQENAVPSTRKSRGTKAKATPPSPPRKPANATRKSKPAADPAFAAVKDAYIAAIDHHEPGAVHNHGQIGKGVKDLIAAGWTPAMVTEAIGLLKQDPYWRDKHLSIQTLGQQGAAKLNGHGPKASKPAGKPPLADWLLEAYGVSDLMAAAQWNDKRKKEIELEYELL